MPAEQREKLKIERQEVKKIRNMSPAERRTAREKFMQRRNTNRAARR